MYVCERCFSLKRLDATVLDVNENRIRMHSRVFVCVCRDRLSASDMLQVRKVMEHVYEKIINLDSESQTGGSTGEKPSEQKEEEDMAVLAEEKIELLCQDQVRLR